MKLEEHPNFTDIQLLYNKGELNGCGGKGSVIKPPYRVFYFTSCLIHDYSYYIGGTEIDRLTADKGFLKYMLIDCNTQLQGFKRVYYILWAYLYYLAVRLFGKKYFNYTT